MRDIAILLIVLGSIPLTLIRPQIGLLMWFWLSLMNPQQYVWYADSFRLALVVALATIIGWLVSREPKQLPSSPVVKLLILFTFWITLAAIFAIHPDDAIPAWEKYFKILLMTFVAMFVARTPARINQLVWIIVISIGWYGFKGGIFTVMTGGENRVWGPPGTFIEGNNELACALIMILPLLQHLRLTVQNRWIRLGFSTGMGLTVISILGSYSRGGLLGLGVMLGFLALKTRHRIITMFITISVLGLALTFLPQGWYNRMYSIEDYQTDESAQGRFDAWNFAFRLALDHPLTGGGQLVGNDDALFRHYVPTASTSRAAHSIYFQVLGETGFVGLGIYLALLIASFRSAGNVLRLTRGKPELAWAHSLATMIQVSLVGYSVAGAFLSLGFFDLYYAIIAVIALTEHSVRKILNTEDASIARAGPGLKRGIQPISVSQVSH